MYGKYVKRLVFPIEQQAGPFGRFEIRVWLAVTHLKVSPTATFGQAPVAESSVVLPPVTAMGVRLCRSHLSFAMRPLAPSKSN
jgi:hypothetical protein